MGSLKFDSVALLEFPVEIEGKRYVLREADGETCEVFNDKVLSVSTLGPDGKPTAIKGLKGIQVWLVSRCLKDVETNTFLNVNTIGRWPFRVVSALFDKAQEISGLGDTVEAKKDSKLDDVLKAIESATDLEKLKEDVKEIVATDEAKNSQGS